MSGESGPGLHSIYNAVAQQFEFLVRIVLKGLKKKPTNRKTSQKRTNQFGSHLASVERTSEAKSERHSVSLGSTLISYFHISHEGLSVVYVRFALMTYQFLWQPKSGVSSLHFQFELSFFSWILQPEIVCTLRPSKRITEGLLKSWRIKMVYRLDNKRYTSFV